MILTNAKTKLTVKNRAKKRGKLTKNRICYYILEKMQTESSQKLLSIGIKQKYTKEKIAVKAIISTKQKKILS